MKTKKIFLFMLLMAVSMVANAKDYGFKIGVVDITSDNYQSYQNIGYDYDPEKNVLHITSISQSFNIVVDGDVNRNLNLSIDADISVSSQGYQNSILYKWLRFNGSGNHVISGTGSLSLTSSVPGANMYNNPFYIGTAHVTIKDITLNIIAYGGCAFDMKSGGSLTFYHSAVTVKTADGKAVKSENGSSLSLKYCKLQEGQIDSGHRFVDSNGKDMDHIDIEQTEGRIPVDVFNVTVQEPVIGQTVGGIGATVDCSQYCYPEVKWRKNTGPNSFEYLSNSDIFEVGYAYSAQVTLHPRNSYVFSEDPDFDIIANGQSIPYYWTSYDVVFVINFPQLANTYYDLWIGGKQVNDINQNDVLEDGGSVRYKKLLGLHYLYLNNANIKNTGNSQLESTAYGRGIYSTMSGLSISVKGDNSIESTGEGIYFTGNLSLLGGKDTENTLNIKGSSGIKTNSQGTALQVYNMKLTAEATSSDSGIGIGGTPSFSSNNTNCTMTVSGANTVVKASGEYLSLGRLKDLVLEDGLQIVRPSGAYFANNNVRDASGTVICGPWVVIMGDTSITTGLNEADTQSTTDQPMYNLSGQRVGKDYKGIVIQNGKKVVIK